MSNSEPLFHRAHYNIIAAQYRRQLSMYVNSTPASYRGQRAIGMVDLALDMAKRLQLDNPNFNPVDFLNACSPDTDRFPLDELWETHDG